MGAPLRLLGPSTPTVGFMTALDPVGLDPTDPYPLGYSVADTWGDAFDLMA